MGTFRTRRPAKPVEKPQRVVPFPRLDRFRVLIDAGNRYCNPSVHLKPGEAFADLLLEVLRRRQQGRRLKKPNPNAKLWRGEQLTITVFAGCGLRQTIEVLIPLHIAWALIPIRVRCATWAEVQPSNTSRQAEYRPNFKRMRIAAA